MIKTIISIVILGTAFIFYIRRLERKTLFLPSNQISYTPADIGLRFDDVYFKTNDGVRLNGWFIPKEASKATLLFIHGNAGNISDRMDKLRYFHDMGVNVFIFDYRGYGKSAGRPTEEGLYRDAEAAYDYLTGQRRIAFSKIVIYGASLGGAVAVDLAAKKQAAGLIVDSSFSSGADMAKIIFPMVPQFLIRTKLDSVSKIGHVVMPKLFIHSKDDEVVPYALGRKLYEAAGEPKSFVDISGNHNGGFIISEQKFTPAVQIFLDDVLR